jgi:hypothetical protein
MPSFAEHCAETTAALGEPFEEVHRWLDEFAGKPPYGMRHRKLRHITLPGLSRSGNFGVTKPPRRRGCTLLLI